MSFLSKLSALRKTSNNEIIDRKNIVPKEIVEEESLLPTNYSRFKDPAIERLKEMRRKENMKNNEGKAKKPSKPSSRTASTRKKEDNTTETRFKRKLGANSKVNNNQGQLRKKPEPIKKISFEELMKQAENNASTKQPETNSETLSSPQIRTKPSFSKPGFKSRNNVKTTMNRVHKTSPSPTNLPNNKILDKAKKVNNIKLKPVGVAKPNAKLLQKIKSKHSRTNNGPARSKDRYYDEDDEDMDDFIEDDEDYSYNDGANRGDPGYNRDEIWKMFNRGKSRLSNAYDDYDQYDEDEGSMEANEFEIMEEEEEAERMAKLEDKREAAWLKRHEREKRSKKLGK